MVNELDAFLAEVIPVQEAAERSVHDGNEASRLALWSRQEPITLFGADMTSVGFDDVEPSFRKVASWFSDCTDYAFEVVAAGVSGDLAYTVGYEHSTGTVVGAPRTYTLRVTHIYPRENGQWRIVHRQAICRQHKNSHRSNKPERFGTRRRATPQLDRCSFDTPATADPDASAPAPKRPL